MGTLFSINNDFYRRGNAESAVPGKNRLFFEMPLRDFEPARSACNMLARDGICERCASFVIWHAANMGRACRTWMAQPSSAIRDRQRLLDLYRDMGVAA